MQKKYCFSFFVLILCRHFEFEFYVFVCQSEDLFKLKPLLIQAYAI